MFVSITLCLLLLLSFRSSSSPVLEDGYLALYVTDAANKRISNISLTCREGCGAAVSDSRGRVRLKLPPQIHPGDWVTLRIVSPGGTPYQVLISPWNDQIQVPRFEEEAKNTASVVVIRKGDKNTLRSGVALRALTERCNGRMQPKGGQEITDEERQLVRKELAETVGLTSEALDQAIRDWGRSAKDPYEQGLIELYENNYLRSEELLKSYEIRTETKAKADADLANVAFFLGQSFYYQGRYSEALKKFRETAELKKDDEYSLNWLGFTLTQSRRYAEAEPLIRRSLAIVEQSFGPEHPMTALSLSNLAVLLREANRLSEAEPLMRRALAIDEKILGPDQPRVAHDLYDLAGLLSKSNRFSEAEPLIRRALAIDEKIFGPNDPRVAADLNALAILLKTANRLSEAEPLMRRVVAIFEESFGPDHPDVAASLNNLAVLLSDTNRLSEAEPLMRRALAIDEKILGPDHPSVAIKLNNLATVLKDTNRFSEAEPLMRRVVAIFEESLGLDHPHVAIALNNLAMALKNLKRYGEAESLMRRALAIDEKILGPDHSQVAIDLHLLAQLLKDTSRPEEAEKLEIRAARIKTKKP